MMSFEFVTEFIKGLIGQIAYNLGNFQSWVLNDFGVYLINLINTSLTHFRDVCL